MWLSTPTAKLSSPVQEIIESRCSTHKEFFLGASAVCAERKFLTYPVEYVSLPRAIFWSVILITTKLLALILLLLFIKLSLVKGTHFVQSTDPRLLWLMIKVISSLLIQRTICFKFVIRKVVSFQFQHHISILVQFFASMQKVKFGTISRKISILFC